MGLEGWGDKKIEALSKGMSQKVQFIAAVVAQPELLILDEPFSGLDPVNAESLKDAVLEMRRRGTTVIFCTHDMATAEKMCDRIFMIFKGRKVLDGTLDDIQAQYGFDTVRVRTPAGAGALPGSPASTRSTTTASCRRCACQRRPAAVPAAARRADRGPPLRDHAPVAARHLRPHRAAVRPRLESL